MVQALTCIALLQFTQIQASTKMLAFTIDHRGTYSGWQGVKHIADSQNETVVERIALFATREADDGDFFLVAADFQLQVLGCHRLFHQFKRIMVINSN